MIVNVDYLVDNSYNLSSCRLHMVFSSPRHLMVAGGCIIIMEIVYQMDFSLLGFLMCALILGFGKLGNC